jgi:hypothetical protein
VIGVFPHRGDRARVVQPRAFMAHPDGCECIVWRVGTLRCELWSIAGAGVLKVFDGPDLTHEEALLAGTCYQRAEELRRTAMHESSRHREPHH